MTKALILDACLIGGNMRQEVKEAVYNRIIKILIIKGGKLERELKGNRKAGGAVYKEYAMNGFFHFICEDSVTKKYNHLLNKGLIKSDDQHIVALALVSGANILHTEDKCLISDFINCNQIEKNTNCISSNHNPKRKVIKSKSPNSRNTMRLLREAEVKFDKCECIINGGGC